MQCNQCWRSHDHIRGKRSSTGTVGGGSPGRLHGARHRSGRPAGRVVRDRPRRGLRSRGRVGVRKVHDRVCGTALPATQRQDRGRPRPRRWQGHHLDVRQGTAPVPGHGSLDGLPRPAAGHESHDSHWRSSGGELHAARPEQGRGQGVSLGGAAPRAYR